MNERQAIYQRVAGDAQFQTLAPGGLHYLIAPEKTVFPYAIMMRLLVKPEYTFGGLTHDSGIWRLKGVANGATDGSQSAQEQAEAIIARIDALLNDYQLPIDTGRTCQWLRRERTIPDYLELGEQRPIFHVGYDYRLEISTP